jgi:hypothetical protein
VAGAAPGGRREGRGWAEFVWGGPERGPGGARREGGFRGKRREAVSVIVGGTGTATFQQVAGLPESSYTQIGSLPDSTWDRYEVGLTPTFFVGGKARREES